MLNLNSEGRYLHPTLAQKFDPNLEAIFGPVDERTESLSYLAYDDDKIDEIISSLPHNGIINLRGRFGKNHKKLTDHPKFELDIYKAILQSLEDSQALFGYKLPILDLSQERTGLLQLPWHVFVVRTDVNREVNVGHILKNIIRLWDIRYNDPVFVRITTKDGSYVGPDNIAEQLAADNIIAVVNDHQHGGYGRLFMGAHYALVDPIYCNKMSTDSEMYHKRNGIMLQSTWEQRTRNSQAVVRDKKAEGNTNIHETDLAVYEWGQVLEKLKVDYQSSGIPKEKLTCNRGKDLYKYYTHPRYRQWYSEVISAHTRIWPEGELTHEVPWGVFTFLDYYQLKGWQPARLNDLLKKIEIVLKAYYPDSMYGKNRNRATTQTKNTDPTKRTFWGDTNSHREFLEKIDSDDYRIAQDKGVQMAATLHHMLMSYNKYLLEKGKQPLFKSPLPAITTSNGKNLDYKNPFRIYQGKDIVAEYDWSSEDDCNQTDYSDFENDE